MTLQFGVITSFTFNGVDLTGSVSDLRIEPEPEPERTFVPLQYPIQLYFRTRSVDLSPRAYQWLLGRRHPRISRMHAAYRRRSR